MFFSRVPKRSAYIIILGLLVLGISSFFRFYGLRKQGFVFFDEGALFSRAAEWKTFLSQARPVQGAALHYVDSKICWVLFLALLQTFFPKALFAPQYASALVGILSILVTCLFASRFYRSREIGILSAAFLGCSSYHAFYSRLALPESAAIFLVMLSSYFYFKSIHHKRYDAMVAGVFFGLAFLTVRFRVVLLPVFVLFLELHMRFLHREVYRADRFRYFLFILSAASIVAFGLGALWSLSFQGIGVDSYISLLKEGMGRHQLFRTDVFSFLTYPFFIYKFDGSGYLLLLMLSLLFLDRKPHLTFFPAAVVATQIIFSSLIDEKAARSISVVLPFMSMLCGATAFNIYNSWGTNHFKRTALVIAGLLVFVPAVRNSLGILKFKSDMREAVAFVQRRDSQARIISTDQPVTLSYASGVKVHQLTQERRQDLELLSAAGYKYILIDPLKFIANTKSKIWGDAHLTDLLESVEGRCSPVAVFDHFPRALLERFLFEHNVISLKRTLHLLGEMNADSGKIKVYEVDSCLQKIKQ